MCQNAATAHTTVFTVYNSTSNTTADADKLQAGKFNSPLQLTVRYVGPES